MGRFKNSNGVVISVDDSKDDRYSGLGWESESGGGKVPGSDLPEGQMSVEPSQPQEPWPAVEEADRTGAEYPRSAQVAAQQQSAPKARRGESAAKSGDSNR